MKSRYKHENWFTETPDDNAEIKEQFENVIKYGSSTMSIQLNNEHQALEIIEPQEIFSIPMEKDEDENL